MAGRSTDDSRRSLLLARVIESNPCVAPVVAAGSFAAIHESQGKDQTAARWNGRDTTDRQQSIRSIGSDIGWHVLEFFFGIAHGSKKAQL